MKKSYFSVSVCTALIAVWGCKQEHTDVKQLECVQKNSVEVSLPMALAVGQNSFIVSDFKDQYCVKLTFNRL